MAGVTGLEPAAFGVTGRRSNRLSYTPANLSHTSENLKMVGGIRFELMTSSL